MIIFLLDKKRFFLLSIFTEVISFNKNYIYYIDIYFQEFLQNKKNITFLLYIFYYIPILLNFISYSYPIQQSIKQNDNDDQFTELCISEHRSDMIHNGHLSKYYCNNEMIKSQKTVQILFKRFKRVQSPL